MAIARYLAMTADEFAARKPTEEKIAWMACHFSPYSTSLSNLPQDLPAGSLLILNDSTPPDHQDPMAIAEILNNVLRINKCSGLMLDFQRPGSQRAREIIKEVIKLDFPVCISENYAKELDCPIFLPPLPLTTALPQYISPWEGREIWLDVALSCEQIRITKGGASSCPVSSPPECPHADNELHCHYQITVTQDSVIFDMQRTKEDLAALAAEAELLGIAAVIGLYQELK